jgi:hypothetical protein
VPPRSVIAAFVALASAAFVAAISPSSANAVLPGRLSSASPGQLRTEAPDDGPAVPVGSVFDDVLTGVSCNQVEKTSFCSAVGYHAGSGSVFGLNEDAQNGKWLSDPVFGSVGQAELPFGVSCASVPQGIPSCLAVGRYYIHPDYPVQLIAPGSWNGFSGEASHNPPGATWSDFAYVSCPDESFCMLMGARGTAHKTGKGKLDYVEHANVYKFTLGKISGSKISRVSIPDPLNAHQAELAAVSCPTTSNCMAVGNATTVSGRSLPFYALRTAGTWLIKPVPQAKAGYVEALQSVHCTAPGYCIVVGDLAGRKSSTAFAARYVKGRWSVMRTASRAEAAFFDISCATPTYCVAVGVQHSSAPLIEAWKGTTSTWVAQVAPGMARPLNEGALLSVSCISATDCTAVGYRHDPKNSSYFTTLALGWTGFRWKAQKTFNQ